MIKVLVAIRVPGVDVHDVIQAHRRHLVELMQQWTRVKRDAGRGRAEPGAGRRRRAVPARRGDPLARRGRRPAAPSRDRPRAPAPAPAIAAAPRRCRPERREVPPMSALAAAARVSKVYGSGAAEVHALRERRPDGRARRAGRGDGPERLGQEHPADHRRQPGGAHRRRGAASAACRCRGCPRNERAALRRRSIGYVFQDFNLLAGLTAAENVVAAAGARRRRGARRPGRRRWPRWTGSASPSGPTTSPTSCPAASGSGWPSPGRWSATATCCSPTSRPARSTRSTARR